MSFAEGYVEVAERIGEFYQRFPEGRLQAEIVSLTDSLVVMRAYAYRTPDDPLPGTGHSTMSIPGLSSFTKHAEVENCETSAIGRAIVMVGIPSKKVASADEVRAKSGPAPRPVVVKPVPDAGHAAPAEPVDLDDDGQWASVLGSAKGNDVPPATVATPPPDEEYRHNGPTCPDHQNRPWKDTPYGAKCTAKVGDAYCKWKPSRKWLAAQEVAR